MTGAGRATSLILAAVTAAACNGGAPEGDAGAADAGSAPLAGASPGGIWHALGGAEESMTLLVAESGELKLYGAGPAFGSGALVATGEGRVAGSFDARDVAGSTVSPARGSMRNCEVDGSIVERVSMHAEITCADGDGGTHTESRTLLFDPHYMSGSSLEQIAGNYTLPFDRLANTLSINDDGVLFGIYVNGAECTVNGRVDAVEHRFNLYSVEWTFSSCDAPHARFEGASFSGLGFSGPPGRAPGSLMLLLTATVEGRFEFLSLVYEPA